MYIQVLYETLIKAIQMPNIETKCTVARNYSISMFSEPCNSCINPPIAFFAIAETLPTSSAASNILPAACFALPNALLAPFIILAAP